MTEEQYHAVAAACDSLLRSDQATLDWVAVPWLHILSEHPNHLRHHAWLFDLPVDAGARADGRGPAGRLLSQGREHAQKLVALMRGPARAVTRGRAGAPPTEAVRTRDRVDMVIVSSLVNPDHLATMTDFYFGDLQAMLAERGVSSLLVLRNMSGHRTETLRERSRREGPCGRMVLPDVEALSDELDLVRRCLKTRRQLRSVERAATTTLDRIVAREAGNGAISPVVIENLRLHGQLARLCQRTRPSLVMTLYEGHAVERCVWHAARTSTRPVLCVGYQHTVLRRHAHAMKRSLGPKRPYDPDLILTVGDVTREVLEKSPGLGAVAMATLGTHRRHGAAAAEVRDPVPACLVLPEGMEAESMHLFEFALECARRQPGVRFIFRTHPILPFERIAPKLDDGRALPRNVEVSPHAAIEDDFKRSGYLLYRGSSAAIYGILAGLKAFYLGKPGEMDIDPLWELPLWREHVYSVDDWQAVYGSDRGRSRSERMREWSEARAFCERYVQPVRQEAVDRMLRLAQSARGKATEG